eukprot:5102078-Pleurochrysis_carterae.AAC.1
MDAVAQSRDRESSVSKESLADSTFAEAAKSTDGSGFLGHSPEPETVQRTDLARDQPYFPNAQHLGENSLLSTAARPACAECFTRIPASAPGSAAKPGGGVAKSSLLAAHCARPCVSPRPATLSCAKVNISTASPAPTLPRDHVSNTQGRQAW